MQSSTATALAAGIVTVITPLVFPAISLPLGVALYTAAAGLFIYAGRDKISALLPESWRNQKSAAVSSDSARNSAVAASTASSFAVFDSTEGPAELTQYLAGKLIAHPISPKTLQVLRLIASTEKGEFHLDDAVQAVRGARTYKDLSGVWAGLTRRTRNIFDDSEAYLIHWWESYDDAGAYIGWVGKVSEMTHASLRRQFGLV